MNNASRGKQRIRSLAALAALAATAAGLSPIALASPVTRVYVVDVPAAKDHAFREGVMAWNKCLRANGDHSTTEVYDSETGELGRYAFLAVHPSWADMDRMSPAGKACDALFRTAVLPQIGDASSDLMVQNPKITHMTGSEPDSEAAPTAIAWVIEFRIKPGQDANFHSALEKYAAAANKTHWAGQFVGYDVMASGQGGEDFIIMGPNKNWADAGTNPKPSATQMMYSVYGESRAKANRKVLDDSIAESWSDIWSYDKTLSYLPQK
jgi:hypothetical protein